MRKKIALLLAILMLVAAMPVASAATVSEGYITGQSSYAGGVGTYYYSDDYFASPASLYNPSLATMSFYATISGDNGGLVTDMLTNIGFSDIAFNDDYYSPAVDTMGTVIAHKTIYAEEIPYTLIIVDTRAGTASAEWAGNFTIGENGNHKGFDLAAEEIMRSLNAYISQYAGSFESKTIKIWTMGYSRSAASANLFAAKLVDEVRSDNKVTAWGDGLTLTQENIYAYTFETPVGGSTDCCSVSEAEKNYTNIHNIVNPADLVTMVAPGEWGFVRYGVDENVIPASNTERYEALYDDMLTYFFAFGGSEVASHTVYDDAGNPDHILSTFEGKRLTLNGIETTDITIEEFLDILFTELTTAIGSRESYAAEIETVIRRVIAYACYNLDQDLIQAFADAFREKLEENYSALLLAAVNGKDALSDALSGLAEEASKETGFDLFTDEALKEDIQALMPVIVNAISADLIYSKGEALLTLVNNLTTVTSAHYLELGIAWLECQDPNYNQDASGVVPAYCVYEAITTAKVGNFTVTSNDVSKNITITRGTNGFRLYSTAEGKYITLDGSRICLSDTPQDWYYDGGFYGFARKTLLSRYSRTYLTFTADGFSTSSAKKAVTITETVRSTDHSPCYSKNDNATHTVTCAHCKATLASEEAHCYHGDTCACGQVSPEAAVVTGVTVSSKAVRLLGLFTTGKKITITADSAYAVTNIRYSLDGGASWTSGTDFTVKKSVPNFLIEVTDAAGNLSQWSYVAVSGIASRV